MNIESIFTTSTDPDEVRPLTENETVVFSTLLQVQETHPEEPVTPARFDELAEESGVFSWRVAAKRFNITSLHNPEFRVDPTTAQFLLTMADRPGISVMIAHSIVKHFKETGRVMKLAEYADTVCPEGFPTLGRLHRLWDAQKMENGGNFLDTPEAWT